MTASEQRELIELWLLAGEGAADETQLARLNALVEAEGEARACLLDVTRQQGWLAWNAAEARLPAAMETLSRGETASAASASPVRSRSRWAWAAMAASLLGFFAGYWYSTNRRAADVAAGEAPLVHATMVSSTGALWGPGNSANLFPGHGLAGGDALQLLEGIAEFRIGDGDDGVCLQLEGPASVVLTAQGAAIVSYGKVIIKTGPHRAAAYPVETSFGRVLIERDAEVGLVSFGSTAEVHGFRGDATVESPWIKSDDGESEEARDVRVAVTAGEAVHFRDIGGAALDATRTPAQRRRFTLQVPMSDDFLTVGGDYVREIIRAKPAAYWRFEGQEQGVVRNAMGDRFHGRLKGKIGWVGPEGNRAIEFGVTPEPGSLIVDESWDEVLDGDFSLEAWIKPSHYHLGSIVGFIGEFDWQDRRNKHGVLLEVHGASQPSNIRQPERIRFLHRATLGVEGGVSCYSDRSYQPRRWQHVAAVREGDVLRLYMDGELVQEAVDPERIPLGLQLVMGQLYTETVERFFIGHVDEVAIYDRPLSADEVAKHFQLLRPAKKSAERGRDAI
jgi:hypothetical protein